MLFIQQDAHLLAAVQVVVYAGAIVVLFLFVIMLLGVDHPDTLHDPLKAQRLAAIVLGLVLVAEISLPHRPQVGDRRQGPRHRRDPRRHPRPRQQRRRVAHSLFTDFLWPFEITSALPSSRSIGAVVLARRSRDADESLTEDVR